MSAKWATNAKPLQELLDREKKNRATKEENLKAKEEELRKAQSKVTRLEGKLTKSHDVTAIEASELKAKLEVIEDKARTAAVLAVSEFQASDEMRQFRDSNYDQGVRDFLYIVVTSRPD